MSWSTANQGESATEDKDDRPYLRLCNMTNSKTGKVLMNQKCKKPAQTPIHQWLRVILPVL